MNIRQIMMMGMMAAMAGCEEMTVEQQVDKLYDRMPQQERIAQLKSMYMDDLLDEQGQLDTAKCRQLIPYGIGHFSQYASQKQVEPNVLRDRVAAVQEWLMKNTPNGIPALFHEEVLTGINTRGATIYPQQIGQACSFNPELAELKTKQTGTQMRRMGGILSLSPMVDVCRTPSFNRLEESYGEDGYLSAVMGCAFVRGLQQGDMTKGVGTCSKHFLGYGGGGDAEEQELMEDILMPHEAMIRQEGSRAVMPGYHAMADSDGKRTNCVANGKILNDILRGYLGFDGMVVSDYTAIDQLTGDNEVEKAAQAINGGCDVDFPFGANYKFLQEAIDKGMVKQETLERAVKNVLRYKIRAGLMDKTPYLYSTEKITLDTKEERQTAYDIATQSVVLLKNDGILPLDDGKTPEKILITGPNANTMWAMCGDYSFPAMTYFWKKVETDLDHPHIVGLLEGMRDRKPSHMEILYSRGCDWTEEIETKYGEAGDERAWEYEILHRKVDSGEKADENEALGMAKQADVIIAAMGENVMLCGENRDRQGLRLPGKQEQYVEKLLATGKPVVLVMFGGRAQVIGKLAERCSAVIQAWYPGEEGGHAVADILYGKVAPSAKLSVSYPGEEVYEPLCYKYGDKEKIQWPFGYGLTYTTFEYENLQATSNVKTSDEFVELTFQVKNTGAMAATEIAQVYVSTKERTMQLQGFARVALEPEKQKTVTMRLYLDQLGHYSNEDGVRQWITEPGEYIVKVGASSADIRLEQTVEIKGQTVGKPLRDNYFAETVVSQ